MLLHRRMQMLEYARHRQEQVQLDAPVPHFDQRGLERAAPEQRRIGLQRLEIAADGDRLRDHGAVVEHERRHPLHRIDRGIGLGALRHCPEIDLLGRDLDALLGQKYAHPPRIGGAAAIVEFHRDRLSIPLPRMNLSRPSGTRQCADFNTGRGQCREHNRPLPKV